MPSRSDRLTGSRGQRKLARIAVQFARDYEKLAQRAEAREKVEPLCDNEHLPGERVSETACYDELNVFGTPTGNTTHVKQGERLPHGPVGFTWRRNDRRQG
jgi:hypothetical protein